MSRLDARDRVVLAVIAAGLLLPIAYLALRPILLTAAILALPYGLWWWWDRRCTAEPAEPDWDAMSDLELRLAAPIDPELEATLAEIDDCPQSAAMWRAEAAWREATGREQIS